MGQQVSRDEQTALAVIDRVCEKLERIYGTYQVHEEWLFCLFDSD